MSLVCFSWSVLFYITLVLWLHNWWIASHRRNAHCFNQIFITLKYLLSLLFYITWKIIFWDCQYYLVHCQVYYRLFQHMLLHVITADRSLNFISNEEKIQFDEFLVHDKKILWISFKLWFMNTRFSVGAELRSSVLKKDRLKDGCTHDILFAKEYTHHFS